MGKAIVVNNLSKQFRLKKANPGLIPLVKSIFNTNYETITALDNLSFSINKGEKVAFLGPNGAGKSTAIKILSGILHPTKGEVEVNGLIPWKKRRELSYKIGIIFGQRSQLWPQLPSMDTYKLLSKIYNIPQQAFNKRIAEIVRVLDIKKIINTPVRQLSLGQRMRCEIGATLLHNPSILFLDEPTIGMDISSKVAIRDHLNALSREYGTTIFLTSHDVGDIENICERVIILDEGKKIIDQQINALKDRFFKLKRINLKTTQEFKIIKMEGVKIINNTPYSTLLEVDSNICSLGEIISHILSTYKVYDISISNPPLEKIIGGIFSGIKKKDA
ncbi:MAG: ATP-binding cassette domain-containing protein [Candidatus Paracaedibacteraceae bacterium]|nr:ATP-binding cassette domain-containing protein [Candidatus Paracaedibacteraceae bacterium]